MSQTEKDKTIQEQADQGKKTNEKPKPDKALLDQALKDKNKIIANNQTVKK